MRNVLETICSGAKNYISINGEEDGYLELLFTVAERAGFKCLFNEENGRSFKFVKQSIPVVKLYDREKSDEFFFIDMGDLHVGDENFSEADLRKVLEFYSKPIAGKIPDYVFLAGDILDGFLSSRFGSGYIDCCSQIQRQINEIKEQQVAKVVEILSDYDFNYIAINGNHEYTLESLCDEAPLYQVERKMRYKGKRFKFFDTYIVDFIIAGVGKRMMHLDNCNSRSKRNYALDRVKEFEGKGNLSICYEQRKYPIRFFHTGHLHHWNDMYYSQSKIYISQPGSFLKPDIIYRPVVEMRGRVLEENRILRY